MTKLTPVERWDRRNLERIEAFRLSGELSKLRASGLAALNRRKMYSFQEWWDDFTKRATSQTYLRWYYIECTPIAERFGLSAMTVSTICFLKGYRPGKDVGLMVMEADWPKVRLVTNSTNDDFINKLSYEAQQFGMYVISEGRAIHPLVPNLTANGNNNHPNIPHDRSQIRDRFSVRVETPVEYPPEAAAELQRTANQIAKEIARRIGYSIPKRLRTSKLVPMSKDLKMTKRRLPSGGSYDIVDHLYQGDDWEEQQRRRKLVSSRRYKVQQRLVKPYEIIQRPKRI